MFKSFEPWIFKYNNGNINILIIHFIFFLAYKVSKNIIILVEYLYVIHICLDIPIRISL